MSNSIAIATVTDRNYLQAPADGVYAGVPVPKRAVMFGVEEGAIYQFGETIKDKNFLDGGLPFYGLKGITRWSTENEKYGTLNYVRFFLTSPYQGGPIACNSATALAAMASHLPASTSVACRPLLKAKRQLELKARTCNDAWHLGPSQRRRSQRHLRQRLQGVIRSTNSMNQVFWRKANAWPKTPDPFGEFDMPSMSSASTWPRNA